MMRILFDNQIFNRQRYGGISRYFSAIHDEFHRSGLLRSALPPGPSNNIYLRQSPYCRNKPNDFLTKILSGWQKRRALRTYGEETSHFFFNVGHSSDFVAQKRGHYDLFHPTFYRTHFLKLIGNKPFVLTLFDMINEVLSPEYPELNNIDIRDKALLVSKASHIIAISESTRKDALRIFGMPDHAVSVIHLCASDPTSNTSKAMDAPSPGDIPENFLLFVGDRHMYKNFRNFALAAAPLLRESPILNLVLAGGPPATPSELTFLGELEILSQCHFYPLLDDHQLAFLYSKARCFVFPSLYEGFGIPVLEAFQYGCPALISNTSSLPEVAKNAALYFDPHSVEMIRLQLSELLAHPELRTSLIDKGFERRKDFSWKRCAQEHAEVYRKVLNRET